MVVLVLELNARTALVVEGVSVLLGGQAVDGAPVLYSIVAMMASSNWQEEIAFEQVRLLDYRRMVALALNFANLPVLPVRSTPDYCAAVMVVVSVPCQLLLQIAVWNGSVDRSSAYCLAIVGIHSLCIS